MTTANDSSPLTQVVTDYIISNTYERAGDKGSNFIVCIYLDLVFQCVLYLCLYSIHSLDILPFAMQGSATEGVGSCRAHYFIRP